MDPRLTALFTKADAFVARVEGRHPADLRCGPGCASCCAGGLTVTALEAGAVREALSGLDGDTIARLHARPASSARCSLLGDDDRCTLYAARPLVCRTHGIPIRTTSRSGLPVVSSCALNFTATGPDRADADCILDQGTLSTLLAALNAAAGHGIDRVSLHALLDAEASRRDAGQHLT